MSMTLLDADQYAFFKIVQKDWTKVIDRSKVLEKQFTELSSN